MKTLLLGLGNELYGDDGVGIHVARKLKADFGEGKEPSACPGNLTIEESSLSGLSLLDIIIGYDRLVVVDTIKKADPETGRVMLLEENELRAVPGPSPHYISISQTLEVGRLHGLAVPANIKVVAVESRNIHSLGEGLSEDMRRALPEIIRRVKEILRNG